MKTLKRSLFLLPLVLSVIAVMFAVFATDAVGGYEETDPYVFNYNVSDDEYTGPNFQYFSAYVTDYSYDGTPSYIQSNIFSLYDTVNKEVVPAYCADITVGALANKHYRRLNLEDSTYAADVAGLLRAILHEGFYLETISGETDSEHAARVAAKLKDLGAAAGVSGLTIGEAISGTQTAIWKAVHGTHLEFTDFFRTMYSNTNKSLARYYDLCDEERTNGHIDYTKSAYGQITVNPECDALIASRIKAVYDYLLSLTPVSAKEETVSASSFVKVQDAAPNANADGTYDVTVTATVDVSVSVGDSLTLSAFIDETHSDAATLVDGRQKITLVIENVPADIAFNDVTLVIDGMQSSSEAFLYDADGDRNAGQTMIGMANSRAPVHAEITATAERILNFYKTTLVATGNDSYDRLPLEGINFDIYLVAIMDEYLSGAVKLPQPEDCVHPDVADYVAVTDGEGRAVVNLTRLGMPDGVYLIVEREHPAIKAPVDPFYVIIPATNSDGTGYDYEIDIQPKNDIKGGVNIEKDVTFIGNDASTVDAYANHTWIIGTTVPEDISQGKSFVISDTLDNRLDYIGNVRVNLETADGNEIAATLIADTDYKLTVTDVDSLSEGNPADSFSFELTQAGMSKIAGSIGNNRFDDYMLRLYFDAQINANADMGVEIPNQATLKYINSVNFEFDSESDKPVVYTGAVNMLKVDGDNNSMVLPGAVFEIYRVATAEEIAAGGDNLTTIKGVSAAVIKVSFFDNADMKGEKVSAVTSDEKGKVAVYGLAYGEYYLLETKAPTGYNLLGDAVSLTVDSTSHEKNRVMVIENVTGVILPSTGGEGTIIYTLFGFALMCASAVLYFRKKRIA